MDFDQEEDKISILLIGLFVSLFEDKKLTIDLGGSLSESLSNHLNNIFTELVGENWVSNISTSSQVELTPVLALRDRHSVRIPSSLSATKIVLTIIVLAILNAKKTRFNIKAHFIEEDGAEPIQFLIDTIAPMFRPWAEIKIKYEQLQFKEESEIAISVDSYIELNLLRARLEQNDRRIFPPRNILTEKSKLKISGSSVSSIDLKERRVSERQSTGLRRGLAELGLKPKITKSYEYSRKTGSVVSLVAEFKERTESAFMGAWAHGAKSKPAEIVGLEAAEDLCYFLNNSVLPYNQVFYYLAYAYLSKSTIYIDSKESELLRDISRLGTFSFVYNLPEVTKE